MVVRRRVRTKPYPKVAILVELVTRDNEWQAFDGWAASNGVNPLDLSFSRLLNLIYFYIIRNRDEKGRKVVDDAIANAVSAWNKHNAEADMARSRIARGIARKDESRPLGKGMPALTPTTQPITRKRNMPPPPPGWTSGDTTLASSRTTLKQMMGK